MIYYANDEFASELINRVGADLEIVDGKLLKGNVTSMEDYKYHLGMRIALDSVIVHINGITSVITIVIIGARGR